MLLLLPQRNLALRVVSRLVALAVKETRSDTIQNKQRFLEEFGDDTGAGCGVRGGSVEACRVAACRIGGRGRWAAGNHCGLAYPIPLPYSFC